MDGSHLISSTIRLIQYFQQCDPQQAIDRINDVQKNLDWKKDQARFIELLLYQAQSYYQINPTSPQVIESLYQALKTASEAPFYRIFLNQGNQVQQLIESSYKPILVLASKSEKKQLQLFMDQLLTFFQAETKGPQPPTVQPKEKGLQASKETLTAKEQTTTPAWFKALSKRETEVLNLVAQGLTNKEIATKLFISLPTVKRHLSTVYNKLDAKSRTQALAKAQKWSLLTQKSDP